MSIRPNQKQEHTCNAPVHHTHIYRRFSSVQYAWPESRSEVRASFLTQHMAAL